MGRGIACIAGLLTSLLAARAFAYFDDTLPPEWAAAAAIVADNGLSPEQKVEALRRIAEEHPEYPGLISVIAQVDPEAARRELRRAFADAGRSIYTRIEIARKLLNDEATRDPTFIDVYAPWLIEQVLADREAMLRPVELHMYQPIGEYASCASGFGFDPAIFDRLADPRVIPVLIEALAMPDMTSAPLAWRGVVNDPIPTGRNTNRQCVPIALARLGATEAIGPLRGVLESHHDWYLRDNAAYALAVLVSPGERGGLIAWMEARKLDGVNGLPDRQRDRYYHLFQFGRGLVDRGEAAGLRFLTPAYSGYARRNGASEATYMLQEAIEAIGDYRGAGVGEWARAMLAHPILWMILCGYAEGLPSYQGSDRMYDQAADEERLNGLHASFCELIESSDARDAQSVLQRLADATKLPAIRERTLECIGRLSRDSE